MAPYATTTLRDVTAPTVDGLDIHGQYQPVSDWDAIPQYALMSVKATEGAGFVEPHAAVYWAQFRRRGFRYRGLYHWLRPDSSAQQQFDNLKRFVDAQGGLQVGEFVQVDWEHTDGLAMPTLALVVEFNRLCQQEWPGRVIVYVSDWVMYFHEWLATNPVEPLWYANYSTSNPDSPTGGWAECAKYAADVWQFTSSFMSPGITTRCDANHIFNVAAMDRLAGYPTAPSPTETTTTKATPAPFQGDDDMADIFTHSDPDHEGHPARFTFWRLLENGTKRHILEPELILCGDRRDERPAFTMDQIDQWSDHVEPGTSPTVVCSAPRRFVVTGEATA